MTITEPSGSTIWSLLDSESVGADLGLWVPHLPQGLTIQGSDKYRISDVTLVSVDYRISDKYRTSAGFSLASQLGARPAPIAQCARCAQL